MIPVQSEDLSLQRDRESQAAKSKDFVPNSEGVTKTGIRKPAYQQIVEVHNEEV